MADRLEQAVCYWEDNCFLFDNLVRIRSILRSRFSGNLPDYYKDPVIDAIPLPLPLGNWYKFRDFILKASDNSEFDRLFVEHQAYKTIFRELQYFPKQVLMWSKASRRIFQLSKELQIFLDLTSLHGIKWADVPWPFESFAIELPVPIQEPHREISVDFILVSFFQTTDCTRKFGISALSTDLSHYNPLNRFERDLIKKNTSSGNITKAAKIVQTRNDRRNTIFGRPMCMGSSFNFSIDPRVQNLDVSTSFKDVYQMDAELRSKFTDRELSFLDSILRIVLGTCIYLSTIPGNSAHRSDWQEGCPGTGSKSDPRAISSGSKICQLSSIYKLNAEELALFEQCRGMSRQELCAHFRRGHWRRGWGEAQNPDAERTVWVRPCLVRFDRLEEGQLPGGAVTII